MTIYNLDTVPEGHYYYLLRMRMDLLLRVESQQRIQQLHGNKHVLVTQNFVTCLMIMLVLMKTMCSYIIWCKKPVYSYGFLVLASSILRKKHT
jgi:hypothetical protein